MKLIGILIIIFSCSYGGIIIYKAQIRKISFLESYIEFLIYLKNEITYSQSTIYEIFKNYSCNLPLGTYINNFLSFLNGNFSLKSSWRLSFESISENIKLSSTEKNIILKLGNNLGACHTEGQIEILNKNIEILQQCLKSAKEFKKKKGKLSIILGVGVGLFIAVIFI